MIKDPKLLDPFFDENLTKAPAKVLMFRITI